MFVMSSWGEKFASLKVSGWKEKRNLTSVFFFFICEKQNSRMLQRQQSEKEKEFSLGFKKKKNHHEPLILQRVFSDLKKAAYDIWQNFKRTVKTNVQKFAKQSGRDITDVRKNVLSDRNERTQYDTSEDPKSGPRI